MCFDLKEGSSSSEVGGDTLVGRGCINFDIEGPPTERNIVGVAHFYACANPLTVFALCAGTMTVRNVCWEASRLKMSCYGLV